MGKQQQTGPKPTDQAEEPPVKALNAEGEAVLARVRATSDDEVAEAIRFAGRAGAFSGIHAAIQDIFGEDARAAKFTTYRDKTEKSLVTLQFTVSGGVGMADFRMVLNPTTVVAFLDIAKEAGPSQEAADMYIARASDANATSH